MQSVSGSRRKIMNTRTNTTNKVRKLTMYALLAALVIALQVFCTFFRIGPFPFTLALTPIIVGAAIYGPKCGAFLGFVFSATVFIMGIGPDGGTLIPMLQYSFIATVILCFLKGTVAGFAAGLVYKLFSKKSPLAAALAASALTPIVNTGIFALGMMSVFYGFLSASAEATGAASPLGFLYLTVIGLNFVVEFIVNIALGTVITRVIHYFNKNVR